jgi:hypothetical protein
MMGMLGGRQDSSSPNPRRNEMTHTLFYSKRTKGGRGSAATTEFGIGSAALRALVLLVLRLAGRALFNFAFNMSFFGR